MVRCSLKLGSKTILCLHVIIVERMPGNDQEHSEYWSFLEKEKREEKGERPSAQPLASLKSWGASMEDG